MKTWELEIWSAFISLATIKEYLWLNKSSQQDSINKKLFCWYETLEVLSHLQFAHWLSKFTLLQREGDWNAA